MYANPPVRYHSVPLRHVVAFFLILIFHFLTAYVTQVQASQPQSMAGIGALTVGGYANFQVLHKFEQGSHWVYGVRFYRGTEIFVDANTDRELSDDMTSAFLSYTKAGPDTGFCKYCG